MTFIGSVIFIGACITIGLINRYCGFVILFFLLWEILFTSSFQEFFFTPCEYEDSINCYWDAEASGNGEGYSFIIFKTD